MSRRRSTRSEPARALLRAILDAPDRDRSPGARELVAWRRGDEPAYLRHVRARCSALVALERFGRPLLSVAELPARPAARGEAPLERRWRAARPIVLPGWVGALVRAEEPAIRALERTLRALRRPGALPRFLARHQVGGELARALDDPDRDLEKLFVADGPPPPPGVVSAEPAGARLWVKSATLTSPSTNASGRIRFGFGAEGRDDASPDRAGHARVAALAERCLPVAAAFARSRRHRRLLERLCGGPVLASQHIAYWNAPRGGALLHHDAFDEPARTRQRGVCYLQLSGATAWLALSSTDLARHVSAFLGALAAGEAPWIVEEHFGGPDPFAEVARRLADRDELAREIAAPGCGALASLVNYAPELLGLLVDAGHAWILRAGDAILLPNHGFGDGGSARTCLHAVWCAGRSGAALSLALRRA